MLQVARVTKNWRNQTIEREVAVTGCGSGTSNSRPPLIEPFVQLSILHMRFTVFILACLTLDATTLVYAEDFVSVPLQPYRMGASDDVLFARRSEKPAAMVELSGTLHVGVSEVTNLQFREFVEDTGYQTSEERRGRDPFWSDFAEENGPNAPVVVVSWVDANAYCRWASDRDGRKYRLLNEAEWEFCCRKGLAGECNSRESLLETQRDAVVGRVEKSIDVVIPDGIKRGQARTKPLPVDESQTNDIGLRGMLGNVAEWCQDVYVLHAAEGAGNGLPEQRVIRGGSFAYGVDRARCTYRSWGHREKGSLSFLGFRICYESD